MSTLTVKIMASKYHLPLKELGILRERRDVKVEAGNIQGKPASLHTKSNTNIKKRLRQYQKDSGVIPRRQKLENKSNNKNNCNKPKHIINV